jgi:hypothetical protein
VIIDSDLPLLEEVLRLLDTHLARLEREAQASPDPDSHGIYDSLEHVTGLGFATCQTYLVAHFARSGVSKPAALERGPTHRCGRTIASIVNAAANYWKHHEEWGVSSPSQRERTVEIISSMGMDSHDYTLYNMLHELLRPLPTRFTTVVPFLLQWRDSLRSSGA